MAARRAGKVLGWAALAVAVLVHAAMLESVASGRLNRLFNDSTHRKGQAVDFFTVYWGSIQGARGASLYTYDLPHGAAPHEPPYAYSNFRYFPGFAFTIGRLLTLLEPWPAYWLWVVLVEIGCLVGAWWSWRLAAQWGAAGGWRLAAPALWLGFTPYYLELYMGQFTLVLAVGILGLLALAEAGRERELGRTWVLTLLWKFATALYVPVFHRLRRWGVLAAAAGAVALFTLPYFALHRADLPRFARYFVMGLGAKTHAGNHGLQTLASVVAEALWPPAWALHAGPTELPLWRGGMLVLTLALVVAAWRRTLRGRLDVPLMLCLWTAMYFAVSRDVWEHHTLLLLPVLVWMLARLPRRRAGVLVAGVLLALPSPFVLVDVPGLPPEADPEPHWTLAVRLVYHAARALPAAWLLWVSYRELGSRVAGARDAAAAPAGAVAGRGSGP
ncbi:MAG TPA: glycosyltransferase 87 family protein [Candidatus Saccharimonadales bacterium]|nr:glycosyltransferase 87 family protein [Candidatus Saccharimonadales bacterium]